MLANPRQGRRPIGSAGRQAGRQAGRPPGTGAAALVLVLVLAGGDNGLNRRCRFSSGHRPAVAGRRHSFRSPGRGMASSPSSGPLIAGARRPGADDYPPPPLPSYVKRQVGYSVHDLYLLEVRSNVPAGCIAIFWLRGNMRSLAAGRGRRRPPTRQISALGARYGVHVHMEERRSQPPPVSHTPPATRGPPALLLAGWLRFTATFSPRPP